MFLFIVNYFSWKSKSVILWTCYGGDWRAAVLKRLVVQAHKSSLDQGRGSDAVVWWKGERVETVTHLKGERVNGVPCHHRALVDNDLFSRVDAFKQDVQAFRRFTNGYGDCHPVLLSAFR